MTDILQGLNEAQLKAVTHEKGPLLIVAGAGTGKTTVLTRRYGWLLLERGLKTDNILALTFTEKAAQEMEDRVLQLIPNGAYDFWISTFHSFCQRVLERYALEIGLPNRFKILNETDAWLLLKRHLDELPLDHYRPLGNPVKFLSALLKHFSRAKDEGVRAEDYLEYAENAVLDGDAELVTGERKRLKELADCYFAYQRILRAENCLDFGDLIIETLRLLRERPAVLKAFREQFKVLLIDEFQDTNWAQYELVKLLAGAEKNITVVGDDDQAIYKFRGASLANILQFRDDFPESVTVALDHNYRSKQEILDTAYGFIRKNDPYRLEVKLADTGLSKALKATRGSGAKVISRWYKTLDDEVSAVVAEIKNLKQRETDLSWNDVAILVRSNDGALPFLAALENQGVPFCFYALRGLYAKPLVVDVIAFLSLCDSWFDSTNVWRVLTAQGWGVSAADTAEIIHYAKLKSVGLWQALKQASVISNLGAEARAKIHTLVSQVESLIELARRETPLRLLQTALERTGLLSQILQSPEAKKIEAINLLNSFAGRIKRYEQSASAPTLHDFLEELRLEIESGEEGALSFDPEAGPEMVKVMTIHAAKGLEFRHVFVVSLVDQRFPTRERSDTIPLPDGLTKEQVPVGVTHLEEERRLFYVAMTRAKETLTLTGAAHYGGLRLKKASVFFKEASAVPEEIAATLDQQIFLRPPELEARPVELKGFFSLKRRFSFTQLAAFRNCPLQYKMAHVYRVPVLGSHQRSFGQAMHLTLRGILEAHMERGRAKQAELFDRISNVECGMSNVECGASKFEILNSKFELRVSLDEALAMFEERWYENDQWYPDRKTYDEYKQQGKEAVKKMWGIWNAHPPQVLTLERGFDWKLGEHSLKGTIDRIDELPEGGVAIYDYKTGEPKTADQLESKDKEQLRIYQLAMEAQGLRVGKLAYIYLKNCAEAEVKILQGEERQDFEDEVRGRMDEILASDFPAKPSSHTCRYCDFNKVCEYRKL